MTTFDKNQIPANINSVEKLVVWAACVLQELYPTMKITENIEEAPQLVAQVGAFDLPVPIDDQWTYQVRNRAVLRLSIPLSATWKRNKLYFAATDLGVSATPADYYLNS
jgi:hypothetical protein